MQFKLLSNNTYGAEFDIVKGIRVYTGNTKATRKKYENLLTDDPCDLFTELTPSTLTAQGKFDEVIFNEEEIADMLTLTEGNILKIGCNFAELENPNPPIPIVKPVEKKSKRGRKPKHKKSTRKVQGTGRFFNSQMTFEVYNPKNENTYKIKLFRTGGLQVPGVRSETMTDLISPLMDMTRYLRKEFSDDRIKVSGLIAVMRNYTCRLTNPDNCIFLNKLHQVFREIKKRPEHGVLPAVLGGVEPKNIAAYLPPVIWEDALSRHLRVTKPNNIIKYLKGSNGVDMAEIQLNCERYFGFLAKFRRPVPWKKTKKTTLKILKSGKINFDGCNSRLEAMYLYQWLHSIVAANPQVIYDPTKPESESSESSGESVYDSDGSDCSAENLDSDSDGE